ncbi:MAG TPA: caspase family protein [Pseudonocardiaceae bacterium]|jgi:uncharacterized caspase-like protein|nr:caspase family protein [Pseudonocardiaceae bacterium]
MTTPSAGRRFPDGAASRAVLIGASGFRSARLPDIPAVRTNLLDLHRALAYPALGPLTGEHCVVLGEPKDEGRVGRTLAAAGREATDLLLVYYAGHGLLDDDGLLHLALPSTDPDNIGYTAIPLELIKRDVGRARARVRVLILDCCFSGQAVAAMAAPASMVTGQLKLTGTYVLTSTTATAPSHAAPGARYTAFTGALLNAFGSPEPLSLDGVYRQVDAELAGLGLPRPQRRSANSAAELVLVRGPIPAADATQATGTGSTADGAAQQSSVATSSYPVQAQPSAAIVGLLLLYAALGLIVWSLTTIGSTNSGLPSGLIPGVLMLLIAIAALSDLKPKKLELTKDSLVVRSRDKKVRTIEWAQITQITLRARSRRTRAPSQPTNTVPTPCCGMIIQFRSPRSRQVTKVNLGDVVGSPAEVAKALRTYGPAALQIHQVPARQRAGT